MDVGNARAMAVRCGRTCKKTKRHQSTNMKRCRDEMRRGSFSLAPSSHFLCFKRLTHVSVLSLTYTTGTRLCFNYSTHSLQHSREQQSSASLPHSSVSSEALEGCYASTALTTTRRRRLNTLSQHDLTALQHLSSPHLQLRQSERTAVDSHLLVFSNVSSLPPSRLPPLSSPLRPSFLLSSRHEWSGC